VSRRRIAVVVFAAAAAAALLAGGIWVRRMGSSNVSLIGKGGHARAGTTYAGREKIRRGMTQAELSAALGPPSFHFESKGESSLSSWTYEYADGKIVVALRDGYVEDVRADFK
jgi:hypothetical protein